MAATFVDVYFPFNSTTRLNRVDNARLRRREFEHEVLTVEVYNHNSRSLDLRTGDPVRAALKGVAQAPQTFVGYVHDVRAKIKPKATTPHTFVITCLGPTWVMKNARQRVWNNATISEIAREILREYGLTADIEDHNVRIAMVNQHGDESDWSFLCRIAKEHGYVVYPTGVTVHFHSRLRDVVNKQASAILCEYESNALGMRGSIHEFNPAIGDTTEAGKAVRGVSNVDPRTGKPWYFGNDGSSPNPTRLSNPAAVFTRYSADTVAVDPGVAQSKVQGLAHTHMWHYRATATMDGYAHVAPTTVLYLRGLRGNYDGYWTIIGVTMKYEVFDQEFRFRMETDLGTDTLGSPVVDWQPGVLIPVTKPWGIRPAVEPVLVGPAGLSAPQLIAARGGPDGVRWRGNIASVDVAIPDSQTPLFARQRHRMLGQT